MYWSGIHENAFCVHDSMTQRFVNSLKWANRKINNNASTSAISRLEKVIISKLCVVSDFDAKSVKGGRANTSIVEICRCPAAVSSRRKTIVLENNSLYCRYEYSLHRIKCRPPMIRRLSLELQLQCCRLMFLKIRL